MVHPIAEANEHSPLGNLTPTEFYTHHSIQHSSEFMTNSRGLNLFTQWWVPLHPPSPPLGVICMLHGFTCESSRAVQLTSVYFAQAGFVVCAIDYEGHGFSDGLRGYIPDVSLVVDDCVAFFDSFRARHGLMNVPAFLYGESLGGAIALMIALRKGEGGAKRGFDGMVLMGAMCGLNNNFLPPWPIIQLVGPLAALVPTWPVAITRGSIAELAIKVEWKAKMEFGGPNSYKHYWQRAGSAAALLKTCKELQDKLDEVDVPFLIVNGAEDPICDPAKVEDLYRRASTKDKTIKMYPGMGHLLVGEPEDSVELVFGDVLQWLKSATLRFKPNA